MESLAAGKKSLNLLRALLLPEPATVEPQVETRPAKGVVEVSSRGTRRVLVHGLTYFGQVFADFMSGDGWEFEYYPDSGVRNLAAMSRALHRCDLVYQIGGRVTVGKFLRAAKLLRKNRIVMHWVGSDTLEAKAAADAGEGGDWVRGTVEHWADSPWILDEVRALGIRCKYVPLPSSRVVDAPSPLPEEFSVLVYVPSVESGELYGLDRILQAAGELAAVRFELVGLRNGVVTNAPANIRFHKRIPDLTQHYRAATVVWRPTRHDGLSWMVCEALAHGRHVLWSCEFPGCVQVNSAAEAVAEIRKLYELHREQRLGVNFAGAEYISSGEFFPANFKRNILLQLRTILESR
jgi:hypothetical protein